MDDAVPVMFSQAPSIYVEYSAVKALVYKTNPDGPFPSNYRLLVSFMVSCFYCYLYAMRSMLPSAYNHVFQRAGTEIIIKSHIGQNQVPITRRAQLPYIRVTLILQPSLFLD